MTLSGEHMMIGFSFSYLNGFLTIGCCFTNKVGYVGYGGGSWYVVLDLNNCCIGFACLACFKGVVLICYVVGCGTY